MVASTLPELLDDTAAWRFIGAGIPAAAGLRTGLACAAAQRGARGEPERLREIAQTARTAGGRRDGSGPWLAEHEVKAVLAGAGIPVPAGRVVDGAVDAERAVNELGGAVAVKVSSPAVQHKSELGAVRLGLRSAADARRAYTDLEGIVDSYGGAVVVERMAPPGVELLVAAVSDGVVPALVIGLGGVWTEWLDDVCVIPLPADAARVERGLAELRGAGLLTGARGQARVDVTAAARVAARVGELMLGGRYGLIELNPLVVCADGVVAVDASARLPPPEPTLEVRTLQVASA
jgi:acyl-CoA synthetase (NDP forming)